MAKLHIERESQTWRYIVERTEERLAELRQRNDGELDPVATAKLRGRIAELKEFVLAMGKDPSPAFEMDESY